jgi:DNA mismatch repair ATPase MutS
MAWRYGGWWWQPLLFGFVVEVALSMLVRARLRVVCARGYQLGLSLVTAAAFARLWDRSLWRSELLRETSAALGKAPGLLRRTLLFPLGLLLQLPVAYFLAVQLWPLFETRLLARFRRLPDAWAMIGQCEALAALAAFAFEHPGDCFPELAESDTCFVATALGHPVIAEGRCIRNDVRLDGQLRLLMISGSNMAGKSTLLRAVGVNAVLALAGAPVRARSLRLSPLAIGTAMRFRDSLEDGTSYFFAVLRRLRAVLDLLDQPLPLLFLLDEMLPGTNSHDRLVGAEAIMRRLLAGGAIGLATTHDLELTRVVEHLAPAAANIHFAETVEAGVLRFDYRIHPGVVQSSNALALMRSLGLDV